MVEPKNYGRSMPFYQHPIVKGMIGIAVFVVVAEFLVMFIPPAWSAVSIPITEKIVIELGELPQWIIALVAAGGLWKAWKAEKAAVAVKADLGKVQENVALIERNTNSLTTQLKTAAYEKGVVEGEQKGKQYGVDAAEQLADGQRQGREAERVARATERSADATARVAAASEVNITDRKNERNKP